MYATPRPNAPPTIAISVDSSSTILRIRPSPNPSVLSTASSLVRSRTACAIVLPVTSRMVKSAMPTIPIMILPMSPTCLAQSETNAFSCSSWSPTESSRTSHRFSRRSRRAVGIGDREDVPAVPVAEAARAGIVSRRKS